MFLFRSSQINSVISSFDRFREQSKTCSQSQIKAFASLHSWAADSNNSAIHDVSAKLDDLFAKGDLSQDKNYSLKDIVQMFKCFKELDAKNQQLECQTRMATKQERKCWKEVERCPAAKNIRDFELKHKQAQTERQAAEMKHYDAVKEGDASKTILFKTHMKRLNQELLRQNEAERVLLNAMADLIQQIPDISCAVEEDQNDIVYGNFEKTHKICAKARKQLSRMSLNVPRPVQSEDDEEEAPNVPALVKLTKPKRAGRKSCPPIPVLGEESKPSRLYPKLDVSSDCWTDVSALAQPPPTYSDSESMSSAKGNRFLPSYRRVVPSAPPVQEEQHQVEIN